MIQQFSPHTACSFEEAPNSTRCGSASMDQAAVGELVHELRQPLSTIECLAYYLEITCADESVCEQVRRIQRLVSQANRILEETYVGAAAHS
jgi:nitrogen-specific signal transduction histidine kinase